MALSGGANRTMNGPCPTRRARPPAWIKRDPDVSPHYFYLRPLHETPKVAEIWDKVDS